MRFSQSVTNAYGTESIIPGGLTTTVDPPYPGQSSQVRVRGDEDGKTVLGHNTMDSAGEDQGHYGGRYHGYRGLRFRPLAALAGQTTYQATVSGVENLSGVGMAGPHSWSFTTASGAGVESVTAQVTKYYFFNGQRVAMNKDDVIYYLVGDHLGTTTLVLSAGGNKVAETRHYPYGVERWPNDGTMPTDYRFTGQKLHGLGGLYHMGARFYDSYIARWLSADSIVPNPADPQDFNRYSYVRNSPLNHIDPTGHLLESDGSGGQGEPEKPPPEQPPSDPILYREWLEAWIRWLLYNPIDYDECPNCVTVRDLREEWRRADTWARSYTRDRDDLALMIRESLSTDPVFLTAGGMIAVDLTQDVIGLVLTPYNREAFGEWQEGVRSGVIARDGGECVYCGSTNDLTVDHVKSCKQFWEEGGYKLTPQELNAWYNDPSNLVTACRMCNSQKGSMDAFEWFFMLLTGSKGNNSP